MSPVTIWDALIQIERRLKLLFKINVTPDGRKPIELDCAFITFFSNIKEELFWIISICFHTYEYVFVMRVRETLNTSSNELLGAAWGWSTCSVGRDVCMLYRACTCFVSSWQAASHSTRQSWIVRSLHILLIRNIMHILNIQNILHNLHSLLHYINYKFDIHCILYIFYLWPSGPVRQARNLAYSLAAARPSISNIFSTH